MAGAPKRLAGTALVIVAMAIMTAASASSAAATSAPARAVTDRPIHIVAESAVYHAATGNVDFTLQFDRTPNFRKVDEFGRQADSFQYFIVGDATLPFPQNFDAIIRGDELTFKPPLLPIRNATPSDPDPAAGGWDTIRATVPYKLRVRVLTFSAPLSALSDHSTDGRFAYTLETYRFGTLVDSIASESVVAS
jgi:hypothetical protein